ncbi:MAG: hypothetical protein KDN05_00335 [Verrucomicrobiae bacterium]|nr:hypothetical protein [Verrucomicrobiae bacterium]
MKTQIYQDNTDWVWDLRVREACERYQRTRTIDDNLLVGYDQQGRWRGLQQRVNGADFERWLTVGLESEDIGEERLTTMSPSGQLHLLCNYCHTGDSELHLPYQSVAGGVFAKQACSVFAPNLGVVGGELAAGSAGILDAPRLERVGGDLWAGSLEEFHVEFLSRVGGLYLSKTRQLHAPRLQVVAGELLARSARSVDLPQLRHVLADVNLNKACVLDLPELMQVEGAIQADGARMLSLPSLVRMAGYLSANRARSIHCPKIALAPHELSAPAASEFIRTDDQGRQTLLTSIRDDRRGSYSTEISHVRGDLVVPNARHLHAPNLVSVIGSFEADKALTIHAPQLRWVGEDLYSESAPDYCPADVICGGAWYGHPNAKKTWVETQARRALRGGPGFEL